jgi:magnesium transporter
MELHMSMLNNLMARTANETNSTVRRLTFITTIFMPLTLLAGIGGMSEWTMMTGQPHWRIAYPAFFAIMAIIGLVNYYLLRRLGRKDRNTGGERLGD